MAAAISPDKILKELDALWVGLGRESDEAGVLRACAMTLIAITEDSVPGDVGETLAHLMREHPSRAIVLRLAGGGEQLSERVFAQCWMPFGRLQQICCEQIEITSSLGALKEVPPVVRALTAPDLPVVVWTRLPGLLTKPEFQPLFELASKVVVDSQRVPAAAEALAELAAAARSQILGDLAWTRLTRWREMVAQVFDDPAYFSQIGGIDEAEIEYDGAFRPMSVFYMMGWLRSVLNREIRFSLKKAGECERARLHAIALRGGTLNLRVNVEPTREAELLICGREAHPVLPSLEEHDLLREELSIIGRDAVYEAALPHALRYAQERAA